MQTRAQSCNLGSNRVSAKGFERALKRVGKSEMAKAFKSQPLSLEASDALKKALGILSVKTPVPLPTEGVLDFKMTVSTDVEDEIEGDIPTSKTAKQPKAKASKPDKDLFVGPPAPQGQEIVVGPRPTSTLVTKHNKGLIKVELASYKMSKRVPTFTDGGKFQGMKSFQMTVQREPAYIQWLEDHPNIKTVQLESSSGKREYREVEQREWVSLGSDVKLSLGYSRRKILVPTDYCSTELQCRRKTYEARMARGDKVEEPVLAPTVKEEPKGDTTPPWNDTSVIPTKPFMEEVMMQRRLRNYRLQLIHQEQHHALGDDRGGFMQDVEMQKLGRLRYQLRREKVLSNLPIVPFAQKVDPEELACAIGLAKPPVVLKGTVDLQDNQDHIDDPPQHQAIHTPEGVSILTEISRLEAMDAINDDSKINDDPVFYYMWCADQAQQQHEEQERIELEEIALQQGLSKLEAALPSWFGNGGETERLDRWYKSRCWCDPALEKARLEAWFFERYDLEQSLLSLDRIEMKVPWVKDLRMEETQEQAEDLSAYGSPMSDREAETEAIFNRHRERFAEKARKNRSSSEGPGRVTGNAGIHLVSTSILTDPCAKERNITEGIMSQLDDNVERFKSLTNVVSRTTLGKLFESFKPSEDHYGLYLPQLE